MQQFVPFVYKLKVAILNATLMAWLLEKNNLNKQDEIVSP